MSTTRVTLEIYDLTCGGGGALTVERTLARLKGVAQAYVNPATEMAYVEYDPSIICPSDLVRAVKGAGYSAGEPKPR